MIDKFDDLIKNTLQETDPLEHQISEEVWQNLQQKIDFKNQTLKDKNELSQYLDDSDDLETPSPKRFSSSVRAMLPFAGIAAAVIFILSFANIVDWKSLIGIAGVPQPTTGMVQEDPKIEKRVATLFYSGKLGYSTMVDSQYFNITNASNTERFVPKDRLGFAKDAYFEVRLYSKEHAEEVSQKIYSELAKNYLEIKRTSSRPAEVNLTATKCKLNGQENFQASFSIIEVESIGTYVFGSEADQKDLETIRRVSDMQKNTNVEIYINSKYGFSVYYPGQWKRQGESDAGDGAVLYQDKENDIRCYGGYYIGEEIDTMELSEARAKGNSLLAYSNQKGQSGYIIVENEDNKVIFQSIVLGQNIKCHLYAKVSNAFYQKNKDALVKMAKTLETGEIPDTKEFNIYQSKSQNYSIYLPIEWKPALDKKDKNSVILYTQDDTFIKLSSKVENSEESLKNELDTYKKKGYQVTEYANFAKTQGGYLIEGKEGEKQILSFIFTGKSGDYVLQAAMTREFYQKNLWRLFEIANSFQCK